MAHKPVSRSYAERLRAHRQTFVLAKSLGCSLAEAERHEASTAAWNRWKTAHARLSARMAGTSPKPAKSDTTAPWWVEL
ncbi:hypothetical protein FHW96_002372 [Novosphingobium sp. SG751A]|uniref:hypothetical protein n=1 Tax=Novosphingobium sp. SG751A TaxID=2587000 RepID=UPI0015531434|nr:hypothetical protein [Novosphingobium sp. SG751A]NOW46214.1 hypothetical protein [Novosphingobium sp. SG751A]